MKTQGAPHVCVVGPGTRFLSGITYYTYQLCNALHDRVDVSAVLMRQLLPTRLYPGRTRVGEQLSDVSLADGIKAVDGVDWFWGPSLVNAARHLMRERPSVIVFQWWTGAVLHSYLALALIARLIGAKVIIEFHEVLDTGEARVAWAERYASTLAPKLFALASRYVVHSEYDRRLVQAAYGLDDGLIQVVAHPTYNQYSGGGRTREAPDACCNLLYFGVIRPYKGVEDLIRAFDAIPPGEIGDYWLTVVGETWEGWTLPAELIERSRYRDRITFVNRYVADAEVDGFFRGADVVVLPYHRSSQSGPLHVAFNYGLPVVVSRVGGLVEAAQRYEGAFLAEPRNPEKLCATMREAASTPGRLFSGGPSWSDAAMRYEALIEGMRVLPGAAQTVEAPVVARSELKAS